MFQRVSFDAAYKMLENKTFSFKTNQFELFEDTIWPFDGVKIGSSNISSKDNIWTIPNACSEENIISHVINNWYTDCKHVFVKPLNLNVLLKTAASQIDTSYPVVELSPDEENQEWTLLWTVTKVEISKFFLNIYWAPTHKKASQSRIIEDFEVQDPEESQYKIIEGSREISEGNSAWIQDIGQLPLSDRPALRLEAELDQAQERFRRRIRDARLRAKLSKYRADKLSSQFERKYGFYPVEDEEEAQTEYESNSSNELSA
jgi:hypothetical protein